MRLAIYNQMFGLNGKSFWANVLGHWAVHYQSKKERIWGRTNLKETVNSIKRSGAEVVGLIEVLEGQEEELKRLLKEEGYNYFYIGLGHKTKKSNLCVQEMIVSKHEGIQINTGSWNMENKLGGGGGLAHIYFPKLEINLILAHLALPSKKYYWDQIEFLKSHVKKLTGKLVLMGDFNLSYDSIKDHFGEFELVSGKIKSCSTTPLMRMFYNKDVDHILVKGIRRTKLGLLNGRSDHKLIYVDLEDEKE